MTVQSNNNDWKKIREFLTDEGFIEFKNDESEICLKKDKTEIRIPKKEILPPIFMKYITSVSGISKEKFA